MKIRGLWLSVWLVFTGTLAVAQSVTPNLGMTILANNTPNWGNTTNSNLTLIDTFAGQMQKLFLGNWSSTTNYAKSQMVTYNGSLYISVIGSNLNNNPSSSPSAWSILVLSTTANVSVSGIPTSGQYALWTGANQIQGQTGVPYSSLTGTVPTWNQNTNGNAATATSLAGTPSLCSAGQAARGILASGNATGCFTPSGSGTVTSVGLTTPAWLTVTGSPVTGSGTISITGTSETANYFLAAPNGTFGSMTPRAIVAADIPILNQNTTGTSGGLNGSPAITVSNVTDSGLTSGQCVQASTGGLLTTTGSPCGTGSSAAFSGLTSGTNTSASMVVGSGASLGTTGSGTIAATSSSNLTGGATGSVPYQTTGGATTFLGSPTTSGHTFFLGWQPSGSAIAPISIDLGTYLASPPAIGGTAAAAGTFSSITNTGITGSSQCLHVNSAGLMSGTGSDCGSTGGGDNITTPNNTLVVGGSSTNTTLDLAGAAGEIMAGATPALTYAPTLGVASSHTGTLSLASSDGSGVVTLSPATGSTAATVTVPDATDTLANLAGTQSLTNKTLDGVTPTTMGYVDATSSIQTQLNGKQASLGYTPTNASVVPSTAPSSGQILVGNSGGTAYAPANMSGDATLASTGAITVTKTSGVAFGALATLNTLPLTDLATQSANTVVANVTGSTAAPTAASLPSCSASSDALLYTSATGFSCNTSISANSATTSTTAANLSGTPALPNGTTATTQTTGDNTTKIATDAFVIANAGGGGGAVSSVTNSDGSLTISPTTGAVVASLNVGNANTFTVLQSFTAGIATGSGAPSITAGTGSLWGGTEGTAPSAGVPASGVDAIYADSTAHQYKVSLNNGAFFVSAMNYPATQTVNGQTCTLGSSCNTITVSVDTTTPIAVSSANIATFHFNENATAGTAVTYNLPAAAVPIQKCFSNAYNGSAANTGALTLQTSGTGQYIIFTDGTLSTSGGYVVSGGVAGDAACVVAIDSTHWMLYIQRGSWTKH